MESSPKTEILHIRDYGWNVELKKTGDTVILEVSTPTKKGYSFTVDEGGNVTEYISGDYVRVVMGSVIEKTGHARLSDCDGPQIIRSGSNYVAITAPKVHLNPEEFKGKKIDSLIPKELKEW